MPCTNDDRILRSLAEMRALEINDRILRSLAEMRALEINDLILRALADMTKLPVVLDKIKQVCLLE
jgi:hypothetical protein